eukprot:m.70831 g.70831  ORF g.70831 m.70831 type:complete len:64 (-) comp50156_c0_seq2:331-522(-)
MGARGMQKECLNSSSEQSMEAKLETKPQRVVPDDYNRPVTAKTPVGCQMSLGFVRAGAWGSVR